MDSKFSQLGVAEPIVKAVEEMGFLEPTKVQEESIPKILASKDLIVMSKTGSGKTGAFGIPVLQSIDNKIKEPQALVLTPTRELAVQVNDEFKKMSKYLSVRTTAVYGQHNMNAEIEALKSGASLITGTPGRVYDHIKRKNMHLDHIRYVILDEADRMLDMGFIDQVIQIIKSLPKNRVTLLFSATMPPEIQRICKSYMKEPTSIELETDTMTVDTVRQIYYRVEQDQKRTQLERVLRHEQPDSCMIFCNTRIEVDRVQNFLIRKGFHAEALHGANRQSQRMKTINQFKEGKIQIMVATDVAARGIHIDDLSLVINYDVPEDKNSYVHRVGRTGRAGNSGLAISLVTVDNIMTLYEIEEHVGCLIEEQPLPSDEAVKASVENASQSKWATMAPPVIKDAKKSEFNRNKKGNNRNTNSRNNNKNRSTKTNSNNTSSNNTSSNNKSNMSSNKTNSKTNNKTSKVQQGEKAKAYQHSTNDKSAVNKASNLDHNVKSPYKEKVKKKTKIVMTKMGPIEMVVNENEKPTLIEKVKGFFKRK